MPLRLQTLALLCAPALALSFTFATDAQACGGCFHAENDPETTVVTGHRMAFAVSPTQTVLWDQVEYAGSPQEFAWVLPIKEGAYLEIASASWFEALDAATSTRVVAPPLNCQVFLATAAEADSGNSGCCGMAQFDAVSPKSTSLPESPVTVVHRETVGPYDVVTLSTDVPGVLVDWLKDNGFAVDAAIEPIIDQYTVEGFDFIAMRLTPGKGVQNMKPVRVVSQGASPVLPLRMVAAGTGANTAITLYVIGEGRWETSNFPNAQIAADDLTWDYAASNSDYAERRQEVLSQDQGRTWLGSYARQGSLLSPITNSLGDVVRYSTGSGPQTLSTIAELYVATGFVNKETVDSGCASAFSQYADSLDLVMDLCPKDGSPCADLAPGQIDSREFACLGPKADEPFDDLAAALTGKHPGSVWISRLEGNLSRVALELDLELQAEGSQVAVDNWLQAGKKLNPPCEETIDAQIAPGSGDSPRNRRQRREAVALLTMLAGLGLAIGRRTHRALRPSYSR